MPARRETRYSSIHDAVKVGDCVELEGMVKDGASVNEVDNSRDHFTPLHWACFHGALECLHWLLWHGADTTVTNNKGWTSAHIAAIRGQDACMQALANNGCNLNVKDIRGTTPIHMAAAHGNSFTMNSMLRTGVDICAVDKIGWTPIHSASFHGRLGCVQTLVRWGAKVDDTDYTGCTPAHLAAMEGQLPVLKFLIAEAQSPNHILGARNDNGETPKMLAQQFYKENIVEYISNIEWERDHPEESENLAFPAHVAAYSGDLTHLRMLIENGIVNINERDNKGSTPAHKACGQGHLNVVQWLVEMGANTNIENDAGETPKDVARRFAQLAVMKIIGDDDNYEQDEDGSLVKKKKSSKKQKRRKKPVSSKNNSEDNEEENGSEESDEEDNDESESDSEEGHAGNTEGEAITMSKKAVKKAKVRAETVVNDLTHQLIIAKKNFIQMGGKIEEEEDKKRASLDSKSFSQQVSEMKSFSQNVSDSKSFREEVNELEAQLDYERLRREKLEAQLDEYKREIGYLNSRIENTKDPHSYESHEESVTRKPKKKTIKKKSNADSGGVFIRRNVSISKNNRIV